VRHVLLGKEVVRLRYEQREALYGRGSGEMSKKPKRVHIVEGHPLTLAGAVKKYGISKRDMDATKRASTLPADATARKQHPIASGVFDYFPDALVALSHVSWVGNEQHNPGEPLHWDRAKSTDESDALMRHFLERGGLDADGLRHSAKLAWRALALLQKEIEKEREVNA
jgi:hypothetical protein